jgi:hypothetical protein
MALYEFIHIIIPDIYSAAAAVPYSFQLGSVYLVAVCSYNQTVTALYAVDHCVVIGV